MNAEADVSWGLTWENDVTVADHEAFGALLARCFPRSFTPFSSGRSWSSARPELRVVARADGRPVAHLAVLRRFLRVEGRDMVVGDVGLVAVDPAWQGSDLGAQLLSRGHALMDGMIPVPAVDLIDDNGSFLR